jgi:hypothetical protein
LVLEVNTEVVVKFSTEPLAKVMIARPVRANGAVELAVAIGLWLLHDRA